MYTRTMCAYPRDGLLFTTKFGGGGNFVYRNVFRKRWRMSISIVFKKATGWLMNLSPYITTWKPKCVMYFCLGSWSDLMFISPYTNLGQYLKSWNKLNFQIEVVLILQACHFLFFWTCSPKKDKFRFVSRMAHFWYYGARMQ